MEAHKTVGQLDFDQPGNYVDSEPAASEMSNDLDQISIQLSEDDDASAEVAGNVDPQEIQGGGEIVQLQSNSVLEDEEFADCNLSEANYRSTQLRKAMPEANLQHGAMGNHGVVDEHQDYHDDDRRHDQMVQSPEPRRYGSVNDQIFDNNQTSE